MFFQIAFVIVADRVEAVAVDNDNRWILSPLMRITQFRTGSSLFAWRLLMFHCLFQNTRQAGRGQFGHRCGIGGIDGTHQCTDTGRFESRNVMKLGKRQEMEFSFHFGFDFLALVLIEAIPFVDADYKCPATFQYETGNVGILSEMSCRASISNRTTLASEMACRVLTTENFSIA